jgi:hypothetical protein
MAYKFYLYCPPGDDFSRLFDPMPPTGLDRKWQHMLDVSYRCRRPRSAAPRCRRTLAE